MKPVLNLIRIRRAFFLNLFTEKAWGSLGAHLFVDDGRSMGSLIGVYNRGRWFSKLGLGFGRFSGDTNGRFTWENEFIPLDFFSIGDRLDHQTEVDNGTSFVTNANVQWPRIRWTLRLVVEQRVRANNHATLAEMNLIFALIGDFLFHFDWISNYAVVWPILLG